MKDLLRKNSSFLLPYFLFLLAGGLLLCCLSKAELHLTINAHHNSFADVLFYYTTYLGDGYTVSIFVAAFLFVKYRYAMFIAVANVLASIVTQSLKHFFFNDVVRPKEFFKDIAELYLVPGVDNHLFYSFPSGHTTAAFSLYLSLALITENKIVKFILFCIALTVGFSRVYLSQHFFSDIYTGSFIGTTLTLLAYFLLEKMHKKNSTNWADRSLLNNNG